MNDPSVQFGNENAQEVGVVVAEMVRRARNAQAAVDGYSQSRIDDVVRAVAWAIYRPDRAEELARIAVTDSGLGNVVDKTNKNRRKTKGTLRDLLAGRSVGVIRDDLESGITEYAKPVGVVGAVVPSTNPAATPANNAMMALKARNAVIISPSPKGASTCARLLEFIHEELTKVGAPTDLVQALPRPSKPATFELMRQVDLVVVTGSLKNVRAAYSSGTPALGVGQGNAAVLIDETADLAGAAGMISQSKTFDFATSCSSENSIHIHESVYDDAIDALRSEGGYLLTHEEKERLAKVLWANGRTNPRLMAQEPRVIAREAGLSGLDARQARFFMVAEEGVGPDFPFSGEKLSVVLSVYRYRDFETALDRIQEIYDYQGAGHSAGIHTSNPRRATEMAERLKVARVLINQAHAFGNGGAFDNGLDFTLTMGAGTWAGNSFSDNLSYRHFMNTTRLVRKIPTREPSEAELFGDYWERFGK